MRGKDIKLYQGRLRLDIRKKKILIKSDNVIMCWHRLPREVVESLSLRCSRNVEMWHQGTWLVGMLGDRLMVGLHDVSSLFQT